MKVSELIAALADKPQDAEVVVWLPGSEIEIGPVFGFLKNGKVMVEGNVLWPRAVCGGRVRMERVSMNTC